MQALTVQPGVADSARLESIDPPTADGTRLLARTLALGICGTDRDIVAGRAAQPARQRAAQTAAA